MKELSKFILIVAAAIGSMVWSCSDDEPAVDLSPKMLASEMEALHAIYNELNMDAKDYPVHWDLEDPTTWKGIELDTIANEETGENALVIKSITIYLAKYADQVPMSLQDLSYVTDLKIYGCAGSYFDGFRIPSTVTTLLVDRLDPNDPEYINGVLYKVPNGGLIGPSKYAVCLNQRNIFDEVTIHGVDMEGFWISPRKPDTKIDVSGNTLRGEVFHMYTTRLTISANLSHNQLSSLDGGWHYWISDQNSCYCVPNLQYNDFKDIPDYVFESDFWKKYHENFIGNPGYRPPVE